ncbi:hypothetical protein DFH09DRAFT_1214655 [Mycena vulgaris]|nr:hypothetical protein DFH09DRAFT_1214655 [Mycena vulgaris]
MDLINYYAKHGPKIPPPGAAKSSSSNAGASKQDSPTVKPIHNGQNGAILAEGYESDVEEDDTQEIPPAELAAFVRQLGPYPSHIVKAKLLEFNKTHSVECAGCIDRNLECRISRVGGVRCDACASRAKRCSRSDVFNRWMVRHKFCLSWEKAGEILQRGQLLCLSTKNAPDASTTAGELRTSPRTPIPRVRKAPTGVAVAIDAPALVHERPRPPKRTTVSGPPRADRKRRKVEVNLEPGPEPDSEAGREILPAPPSTREPKPALGRDRKRPASSASRLGTRGVLAARVTATEERLDAIEARLPMPLERATRQHVVAELDRALAELEGNGDVQGAAQRMRALQASLLEVDGVAMPIRTGRGPSEGLLDGEQDTHLDQKEDAYFVDEDVANDFDGDATEPGDDAEAAFLNATDGVSSA